jgi:hypothetical protein
MTPIIYFGMASANGLESFIQNTYTFGRSHRFSTMIGKTEEEHDNDEKNYKRMLHGMSMNAHANAHRRSVAWQAKLEPEVAEEIQALMDSGEYIDALLILKEKSIEVGLLKTPNSNKFWGQIPNPDLDAFG